jgi:hypothetical protein
MKRLVLACAAAALVIAFDPNHAEAQKILFPYSRSWVGGGCVVDDESPKFAEVLYCRACRAAEEKWREEYRLRRAATERRGRR